MKKILLIALGACMFISTVDAQKQTGGEKNFQLLAAPFSGAPIMSNGSGISFRKFNATGTSAWRINLFIGLNSKKEVTGQADTAHAMGSIGSTKPELDKTTSGMTITINPGYEKHFAGTENLSPYVGAELLFSMTTAKVEQDVVDDNHTSTSAATDWIKFTEVQKGKGAKTTFGVNLIAGIDYYIAKHLSLGAEFGFGFSTTSMPDIENSSAVRNTTTQAYELHDDAKEVQGSEMHVGPTLLGANGIGLMKLSWLFN